MAKRDEQRDAAVVARRGFQARFRNAMLGVAAASTLGACSDGRPQPEPVPATATAPGPVQIPEVEIITLEGLLDEIRSSGPELAQDAVAAANELIDGFGSDVATRADFAFTVNEAIQTWLGQQHGTSEIVAGLVDPGGTGRVDPDALLGTAELFRTTGARTPEELVGGGIELPITGNRAEEALGGLVLLNRARALAGLPDLKPSDFASGAVRDRLGLAPAGEPARHAAPTVGRGIGS